MQNILVCTYDEKLLPFKGTEGAVCRDLSCAVPFSIQPGEIVKI